MAAGSRSNLRPGQMSGFPAPRRDDRASGGGGCWERDERAGEGGSEQVLREAGGRADGGLRGARLRRAGSGSPVGQAPGPLGPGAVSQPPLSRSALRWAPLSADGLERGSPSSGVVGLEEVQAWLGQPHRWGCCVVR